MFLLPFEGPLLKIKRARHHYADLSNTILDYQKLAKPTFVRTERASEPWQIEISAPTPKVVACQIGDIAHSLRSALDVMLCDIALIRGVGLSDMAYPFATDEAAFLEKLGKPNREQPFKKLGQDIIDEIAASQPYGGGNYLLRGLHDLNNQDKHRMAVPHASFVSCTLSHQAMMGPKAAGFTIIGGLLVGLNVGEPISDKWFMDHPSEAYTINHEPLIVRFPGEYVLFGNVLTTMGDLISEIEQLIHRFAALALPPSGSANLK